MSGVKGVRKRDWRRVHHSPWFWVGVVMFMAAILTYVFSEDLSLRPKRHGGAGDRPGSHPMTRSGDRRRPPPPPPGHA